MWLVWCGYMRYLKFQMSSTHRTQRWGRQTCRWVFRSGVRCEEWCLFLVLIWQWCVPKCRRCYSSVRTGSVIPKAHAPVELLVFIRCLCSQHICRASVSAFVTFLGLGRLINLFAPYFHRVPCKFQWYIGLVSRAKWDTRRKPVCAALVVTGVPFLARTVAMCACSADVWVGRSFGHSAAAAVFYRVCGEAAVVFPSFSI